MKNILKVVAVLTSSLITVASYAVDLKVGDKAPLFKAKIQDGTEFNLANRAGKWTVLYFFPKADTPGCTKQACAFRDNIKKITDLGADVIGVSVNSIKDQKAFHDKHKLKFSLIADENADVVKLYGTKAPVIKVSKRWTFILDDKLVIRRLEKNVDPVLDAEDVAGFIEHTKASDNQKSKK